MSIGLKVGDKVKWASQAGGVWKDKEGVVVAVIAGGRDSGERANAEIKARTQAGTHRSAFGGGWARDHESYVVEVRQGGPKSKPVLYWPVASKLRKDDSNVEASDS
jgi:hypothetical protein